MAATVLDGIIAYPVTPFSRTDGSPDLTRLAELIERLVASGCHAIAPLGSTGESAYLDDREWFDVTEASVAAVAGRVPTVVGIADLTTRSAVRRARYAEQVGADVVMVLPLSYWRGRLSPRTPRVSDPSCVGPVVRRSGASLRGSAQGSVGTRSEGPAGSSWMTTRISAGSAPVLRQRCGSAELK